MRLGFSTIKDEFFKLKNVASPAEIKTLDSFRLKINEGKINWTDLYLKFAQNAVFSIYNEKEISGIPSESFDKFKMIDVFMLFELASQVETKIKIYEYEREILVLAGRYVANLQKVKIVNLIK